MEIAKEVKYIIAAALMPFWKWFYYAPNTFKELQIAKFKSEGRDLPPDYVPEEGVTLGTIFFPQTKSQMSIKEVINPTTFLVQVLGPFLLSRFILLPAPLLFIPGIGATLFTHAIINLVLAELLTNIHGFVTI